MQLQVDLDTSADQLFNAFHTLGEDHWNQQVSLRSGAAIPVRALPLARLTEVVVHHVDLDIGFRPDRIPEHVAAAGLAWTLSPVAERADARAAAGVDQFGPAPDGRRPRRHRRGNRNHRGSVVLDRRGVAAGFAEGTRLRCQRGGDSSPVSASRSLHSPVFCWPDAPSPPRRTICNLLRAARRSSG